ncbi:MurR/RpiR family transcriptional regulator [Roseovarius spongiae]|uniref:MurR/RpiR family transcriptional regulator n=1 Tax=Roseovarius spongiae TaxID=2320272 RepID=A0A3A8AUP4_9RHOB|nr:MurR/RpiR family transcriptional regulator [Roseovarius spongiae]
MTAQYDRLSDRLRQAGDHVMANPLDTATRSLRAIAAGANLPPATFSRLARRLGYPSFDALRDSVRLKIDRQIDRPHHSFADRARELQTGDATGALDFLGAHRNACLLNIRALAGDIDPATLNDAVDRLLGARRVVLMGALGSTGIVEHMAYMANFLTDNWRLAGRMGASVGSALAGLSSRDALVIVTKPPFARKSILAARQARAQGVQVLVITDSHACPALADADCALLAPSDSPHFFSSYVATLFLVETIIGMLASRLGSEAAGRIAEVERQNRLLEEAGG